LNTAVQLSLDEIKKAGLRGRDVVQQILAFSRKQPTLRQTLFPRELVAEMTRMLRPLLPAQVALVVDSQEDTPSIDADRIQIDQVLMNLVTNAAYAMGSKAGEIRIATRGCRASLSADGPSDEGERSCVLISVTDNGSGMDAETQQRLFEPFFTTKPVGEGTGLGLSVVQGIVKRHGGKIVVDSTLGVGTRFDLYFPIAQSKRASTPATVTTTATPSLEHKGRVLYIDDDEALVFLMKRLLKQSGHEVTAFVCAEEALELLRTTDQHFDVVISDYNMPGANGIDVLREVGSLRPGMPAALISGYITDAMREEAAMVSVTEIVFKPDSAQELVEAINRMLGGT
jgi:two-component system cell cycle sensor histidine kinase/response regulator CckA